MANTTLAATIAIVPRKRSGEPLPAPSRAARPTKKMAPQTTMATIMLTTQVIAIPPP